MVAQSARVSKEAGPLGVLLDGDTGTLHLDTPERFRAFVGQLRRPPGTSPTAAELKACCDHLCYMAPEYFNPAWLLHGPGNRWAHFAQSCVLTALVSVLDAEDQNPDSPQPVHEIFGRGRRLMVRVVPNDAGSVEKVSLSLAPAHAVA